MAIIGTAHVHIRADDKYFESDVRKATAKVKNVTIQLKADVDLAKATKKIRDLRYRITSKDAVLKVDANVAKAEEKMSKLLAKFLNKEVAFNATANTAAANTALSELSTRYAAKRVPFTATANTAAASAQLAWLSRNRTANISAFVDPKTQKALSGLFNTLTGTISGEKIKAVVTGLATNFEGLAVKATAATAAIGVLSASVLVLAGNILSIGGDITQTIGFLALIPTAIGSLAAIVTTAKMSFKGFGEAFNEDAKKAAEALAKLPPEAQKAVLGLRGVYTQIQKPVQNAFWEVMGTSLQDMVKTLLPSLTTGLSNVGRGFGAVTKEIAGGFERMGDGTLENMLNLLGQGLKNMAPGFGALIDSFAILGETGATYLPRFGEWTTEISNKFKNFIVEAEKTGKINQWIETGTQRLQEMGSIIKSTTGFFSGLANAARIAGAPGLTEMAAGMREIRDIVNGEPFQSKLVTILEGARGGVELLGTGFDNLVEYIGDSSTAISLFLTQAGKIGGLTFDSIRTLFDGTGLGGGLMEALIGFEDMLRELQTGFGDLGTSVGILGEISGELFRSMAPGLNQLFETIRLVLGELRQGILDSMPIFNEFIQAILELVQGPVVWLAEQVGNVLEVFSDLPGVIQTVLMSLGLFLLLRGKFVNFFGGLGNSLRDQDTQVGRSFTKISDGATTMRNGVGRSFDMLGASLKATLVESSDAAGRAFSPIIGHAQNTADRVKGAFSEAGAGLKNGMNLAPHFDTVRAGFGRLSMDWGQTTRGMVTQLQGAGSDFVRVLAPAGGAVDTLATKVKTSASEFHNNLAPARVAFAQLGTDALVAGKAAGANLSSGIRTAGGGLMDAIGGPWSLAIMGATALVGLYAQSQADAARKVDILKESLDQQTGAFTQKSRKIVIGDIVDYESGKDAWSQFWRLGRSTAEEVINKTSLDLDEITTKMLDDEGGQAYRDSWKKVGSVATSAIGGTLTITDELAASVGMTKKEMEALGAQDLATMAHGIDSAAEAAEKAQADIQNLADKTGLSTVAAAQLSANYDILADSASSVDSKVRALTQNLDIQQGGMVSARKAARDHAETMMDSVESLKKLGEGLGEASYNNGKFTESFKGSLLAADGTFANTSREAINFSKEMDAVAESVITVGMTEMKRLQDTGAKPAEAMAGALAKMNPEIDKVREMLKGVGIEGDLANQIMSQIGLDPEKLTAAVSLDTADAEGNLIRTQLMIAAMAQGNWEVALSASTDEVKEAILNTDSMRKVYEEGGWEAVAKIIDETGPGMANLMSKLTLAKDEAEVTAILKAEFPGDQVMKDAKKMAEDYDMVDVKASLGIKDDATVPAGIAKQAVMDFGGNPIERALKAADQTLAGVQSATGTMGTLPDVERQFTAVDRTEEGKARSQATMNTLQDVMRQLEAANATGTPTAEAQATLDGLRSVVRDLSANNMAGEGRNAAQRTVDSFEGKETELTALDKASEVVREVNNAKIENKSFSIRGLLEGLPEPIRRLIGFADGGILSGTGVQKFANGGIQMPSIKQYAKGGVENHVAQIARGAWPVRVWAEPETGGEAYVPLHPSKRKRSLSILDEVAEMFGYSLVKRMEFADGGIMKMAKAPSVVTNSSVTQTITASPTNASSPTVITNVYPSAGLNEGQVADSVSENIYWKLSTRI